MSATVKGAIEEVLVQGVSALRTHSSTDADFASSSPQVAGVTLPPPWRARKLRVKHLAETEVIPGQDFVEGQFGAIEIDAPVSEPFVPRIYGALLDDATGPGAEFVAAVKLFEVA